VARIIVDVHLKPEILDPQGRAVQGALGRLGLGAVSSVRQGKQFVIDVDGDLDAATEQHLHTLADTLLCNPVIEDYTMRTVTEEPA
jgi:phosphoribosylformylglycinamidine synthase